MVIVDGAGNIELINSQTEKTFGYSRTELLGKTIDMLVPESASGGIIRRFSHRLFRRAWRFAP